MDAQAHGYAVGAFNVEDMEMIQAVIAAAEAEHAPVFPQTTPGTLCAQAAADGYTSLVIDGSKLSLEENIALARRVVEMTAAYPHRPAVEAELGRLGRKKDSLEVKHGDDLYTDPEEAARFVAETR